MPAKPIQMIPAPAPLDWLRHNAQAQRDAGRILQAQHTMATREALKRALKTQKIVAPITLAPPAPPTRNAA